uniref:Uncharacterized protein n=1 Tax=Rhizophora mucronata TaxID=61149 RepID=A0A2P2NBI6_RHIMU
MALQPLTTA